jgi:DNA-binding MarR family transcriptional regulator
MTIGQLPERLQLRHHGEVGLVNRLVAQRLVRRHRSRADRRQVELLLASTGDAVLRRLTTHKRELRQVGPEIKALLERLREN